jgi:agmatine deiminase
MPKRSAVRDQGQSPAALGYRLPAEWDRHEATWLAWPHNATDWPGKLAPIHWVYAEVVRKLALGEIVRILVNSNDHQVRAERYLRRAGVDVRRVEFFRFETNRGWTRDFGPVFVRRRQSGKGKESRNPDVGVLRFRFNAWAKYADWQKDDSIAPRVARRLVCPLFPVKHAGRDVVLEGGAVDTNGRGTVLTSEQCLLDPTVQVRNPGFDRAAWEQVLRGYLGATNVLWFGEGIDGDDTHGHVDDFCRFVTPSTVVLCREDDPNDANYRPLEENWDRIADMRLEDGSKLDAVPLPMPAPLYFDGRRLPASYANFYVANAAVLVPTFNDPNDRIALGIFADLFVDRPVVGIHAVDLVWGLGTLHCLTREQPL